MKIQTNQLGRRRLLLLARYLKNVPENKFKLTYWCFGDKNELIKRKDNHNCGTTACAIGWATTIPSFKRDGLALYKNSDLTISHAVILNKNTNCFYNWYAVMEFFKITQDEAKYLFLETKYPPFDDSTLPPTTPQDVAQRIRDSLS